MPYVRELRPQKPKDKQTNYSYTIAVVVVVVIIIIIIIIIVVVVIIIIIIILNSSNACLILSCICPGLIIYFGENGKIGLFSEVAEVISGNFQGLLGLYLTACNDPYF
jgi:hypothetical protein